MNEILRTAAAGGHSARGSCPAGEGHTKGGAQVCMQRQRQSLSRVQGAAATSPPWPARLIRPGDHANYDMHGRRCALCMADDVVTCPAGVWLIMPMAFSTFWRYEAHILDTAAVMQLDSMPGTRLCFGLRASGHRRPTTVSCQGPALGAPRIAVSASLPSWRPAHSIISTHARVCLRLNLTFLA